MQNAKSRWAKCIGLDAVVAGLAYLWLVEGHQGAANVLGFWLWFEVVIMILCALLLDDFRKPSRALATYNIIANTIIIAGAAYLGHFALAAALTIAYVMFLGATLSKTKRAPS